jgi:xanthine dehydrogenase small subunit
VISFILNDHEYLTELPPGAVVLDLLRTEAGLTGTKEGCREGDCGACTVILGTPVENGVRYCAVNSCILPVGELAGRHLVTIEGITPEEGLSPLQKLFVDEGASQCGFCTPGIIMSLTGYLLGTTEPDTSSAVLSLTGNVCRCTGYVSIRNAAEKLSLMTGRSPAGQCHSPEHLEWLVGKGLLPSWFLRIESLLKTLNASSAEPLYPESAVTVAGGTDLFAASPEIMRDSELRFLSRSGGNSSVTVAGGSVTVGAFASVKDIVDSGIFSDSGNLQRSMALVSSAQIRSRATVGGNIVNASPIGDLSIIFLALDAKLSIRGHDGIRRVALRDFFKGYKVLDLHPGELLESLEYTLPTPETRINFEKVSMRKHLDIASVNSAAAFRMDGNTIADASFSAGGVAPIPLFLKRASLAVTGRTLSSETALLASRKAMEEVSPIDDVRGSARYKKMLLGRLVTAHFAELFPQEIDPEELL